jgi:hypothetical protein
MPKLDKNGPKYPKLPKNGIFWGKNNYLTTGIGTTLFNNHETTIIMHIKTIFSLSLCLS